MADESMTFYVTGMSSGACRQRITEALARVPGVERVRVDLTANEVAVWGEVAPTAVKVAIQAAGFGLSPYPIPEVRGIG